VHPPSTHPQTHPPTEHTRMSLEHPPHSTKKPPLLPMEQAHPPPPLEHPPPPHHMEYPPPPSEHPHPSSMYEEKSKYFNTPLHQQREFTDAAYRGRPPPPPPPPLVSDQPSQFMSRPSKQPFSCFVSPGLPSLYCMNPHTAWTRHKPAHTQCSLPLYIFPAVDMCVK
jgi:hypothetical protein